MFEEFLLRIANNGNFPHCQSLMNDLYIMQEHHCLQIKINVTNLVTCGISGYLLKGEWTTTTLMERLYTYIMMTVQIEAFLCVFQYSPSLTTKYYVVYVLISSVILYVPGYDGCPHVVCFRLWWVLTFCLLQVMMGGGRRHFLPQTMNDPEYTDQTGKRTDGRDLTKVR